MILSLNILFIALLQTTQVLGSADGVAVGLYKNCITNLDVHFTPENKSAAIKDSIPAFTKCLDTLIQPTDLASCKAVDQGIFFSCMDKQCSGQFGECANQKCPRELFNAQVIKYICYGKYPVAFNGTITRPGKLPQKFRPASS